MIMYLQVLYIYWCLVDFFSFVNESLYFVLLSVYSIGIVNTISNNAFHLFITFLYPLLNQYGFQSGNH